MSKTAPEVMAENTMVAVVVLANVMRYVPDNDLCDDSSNWIALLELWCS